MRKSRWDSDRLSPSSEKPSEVGAGPRMRAAAPSASAGRMRCLWFIGRGYVERPRAVEAARGKERWGRERLEEELDLLLVRVRQREHGHGLEGDRLEVERRQRLERRSGGQVEHGPALGPDQRGAADLEERREVVADL